MAQDQEPVRLHGLFGPCLYTREGGLRVPFQGSATFKLKDDLKALGLVCHYAEKFWELPEQLCSEAKERQLRYLLQEGELPLDGEEGEESGGEDTAAADAPTGGAAGAAGAAVPPTPEGGRKRQREREPEERRFLGGAVVMRRGVDGHVLLQGAPLLHIEPMLRRIFHFNSLPIQTAAGGAAAAAGPGPAAAAAPAAAGAAAAAAAGAAAARAPPQHRWRSSFVLTDAEAQFVGDVVEHRQPRLLQGRGLDDKEPIPPGAAIPARFRPHCPDGTPLRGPYKARNGEAHNTGRQFFSTFRSGRGQFLWADGTEAFSPEAFARNAAWAEDEGIVPPGMGAYAQLVQGLLGGAAAAALAADGWGDGWGEDEDEGWDEEEDGFEEASGLGEECEEEEQEGSEQEEEEQEGSEQEGASSGGE